MSQTSTPSGLLPLGSADSGLSKNPGEQRHADVPSMWVRDAYRYVAPDHELVLPTGVRPLKAKLTKGADQIPPAYRSKRRHSTYLPYLELDPVHRRERKVLGDPKQDPFLENFL